MLYTLVSDMSLKLLLHTNSLHFFKEKKYLCHLLFMLKKAYIHVFYTNTSFHFTVYTFLSLQKKGHDDSILNLNDFDLKVYLLYCV